MSDRYLSPPPIPDGFLTRWYAEVQAAFEERVADTAIANGGEIDAVRAAFKLAATIECQGEQNRHAVMGALNDYWRSVRVGV